jgi:hypothetical protein
MLNTDDFRVQLKLRMLEKAMPASTALVVGDMYVVEGGYARQLAEMGCERVALVDTLETPNWQQARLDDHRIDFFKGDFGSWPFMTSIQERFDVTVAFDVMLHQAPVVHTFNLILAKTAQHFCFVQPVLKEQAAPNSLVFLPGNTDAALHPVATESREYNIFNVEEVNQSRWMWGMTPSFVRSVLAGEGFRIVHEEESLDMPNDRWFWYGCVAERTRELDGRHWSRMRPTAGIHTPDWVEAP